MRRCIFLALLIALTVAAPRANAVSISGNSYPVAIITAGDLPGDIPAGTLLAVYEIVLHSDSAADVTAFDLTFSGDFAQVQSECFGVMIPTPTLSDLAGFPPFAIEQDTHLLPSFTIPAGSDPSEPGLTIGFSGAGYANELSSDPVAIAGAEQAPSVLIAHIVMRLGDWASLSGGVAIRGRQSLIPIVGWITFPEPGTFWLASMSIIGLMTSRRRAAG